MCSSEPYGEQPPDLPRQVEAIACQVREIREALAHLQEELSRTAPELVGRLPIHIDVDTVEHLEFHFDSIDINDLGGELNIGLTSMLKAGEKARSHSPGDEAGRGRGAEQPADREPIRILWPPPQEGAK